MEKIREAFNPIFTCNGVTLHLADILRMKKIKSISLNYVLKNNWAEMLIEKGVSIFKKDYKIVKYKAATISNPSIMTHFNENGHHKITVKFLSETEFNSVDKNDEEHLYKCKDSRGQKISANLSALKSVSWVERM